MQPKAMTMAKLTHLARGVLDARARVEERADSGSHSYVLVVPGKGELFRGRTLLDVYRQLPAPSGAGPVPPGSVSSEDAL